MGNKIKIADGQQRLFAELKMDVEQPGYMRRDMRNKIATLPIENCRTRLAEDQNESLPWRRRSRLEYSALKAASLS
jgi:hypothetical protein